MRFVDSRCIHCGATLRIADDATHVCCQYCSSELHIVRDGSSVATELVQAMGQDLGNKLDVLRAQNDLERLDREWTLERENYMVSEKGGGKSVPSAAGSVIMGILAVGFGIFWLAMAGGNDAPGFFLLFGVVFIVVVIFSMINSVAKASAHGSAEERYQSDRRQLLSKLKSVERQDRSSDRPSR